MRYVLLIATWLAATCAALPSVAQVRPEAGRRAPSRPPLPAGIQLHADIRYADTDNPRQTLDLLLPKRRKTDRPLPVLAFIHGGAWRAGNKRAGHGRVARYVQGGEIAGVSIGYRLSQEAIWPAQIHDCKAAIRWIRAHADQYGLDGNRIAVWGTSAGGHLVAMLGVSAGVASLEGDVGPHTDQSSRVHYVIDFFGPTDFLKMNDFPSQIDHDAADSPESQLVGGAIQQNQDAVLRANPIHYVTKDDATFLIVHGSRDPLVPLNQSEILHTALSDRGVDSTMIRVEGGGHGFRSPEVQRRVRDFVAKWLLKRPVTVSGRPIRESAKEQANRRAG